MTYPVFDRTGSPRSGLSPAAKLRGHRQRRRMRLQPGTHPRCRDVNTRRSLAALGALAAACLLLCCCAGAGGVQNGNERGGELCKRFHRETGVPARATELQKMFWMHFPKAGTSFGSTLLAYACPNLPEDATIVPSIEHLSPEQKAVFTGSLIQLFIDEHGLGNLTARKKGYIDTSRSPLNCKPGVFEPTRMLVSHHPMPDSLGLSRRGVAMFRHPVGRLLSAYNHNLHAHNMPPRQRKKMLRNTRTSQEFARWPGVASCQTKMLVGTECGRKAEVTPELFARAKGRVTTALAFVGLTEHWDLSVCLFHSMHGGQARATSFVNTRGGQATGRANYSSSAFGMETGPGGGAGAAAASGLPTEADDPWDTKLYAEARRVFVRRVHAYGLEVPPELRQHLSLGGHGEGQRSHVAGGSAAAAAPTDADARARNAATSQILGAEREGGGTAVSIAGTSGARDIVWRPCSYQGAVLLVAWLAPMLFVGVA